MNYTKTIICLANSRKHSGRCIAGKEVIGGKFGDWIRPVSKRSTAEVSEEERRYENGQDPNVLDIIEIPMIKAVPDQYQTENHLIDAEYNWSKKGNLAWVKLSQLVDKPATLWSNGESSYYGKNDRVNLEFASKLTSSLALIAPENLTVCVRIEGAVFGNPKRRVRTHFKYKGVDYILAVTDPVAERTFLGKSDGDYSHSNAYLSVSLGEPHTDNYCYKLVAAIITKRPL